MEGSSSISRMPKPSSKSTPRKRASARQDEGLKNAVQLKDEGEQDEEIRLLAENVARVGTRTSVVATSLACTLAAIHLYLALAQYMRPFSIRHHAVFADTGLVTLYVGEVASALAVAASGLAVYRFVHPSPGRLSWKYALNCAIIVTALQMIYWVAAGASLYVSVGKLRGRSVPWGLVWWKPVPSTLMFAFATMSIDSISKMQIDLGLMRRTRYRFKAL